jgi:hypothetical protein
LDSWAHWNPDYTIQVLNPTTAASFVPADLLSYPLFNSWSHLADLVRLWVLSVHGGVWMDASILLGAPLESPGFLETQDVEFVGFYLDVFTSKTRTWFCPVIESWCFACRPQSTFVLRWCREFSRITEFPSVQDYVETLRSYVDFQHIDIPYYLAIHVAAQAVLQLDPSLLHNMLLHRAEDGPYKYLVDSQWNTFRGVALLCDEPQTYLRPMAKIRGHERGNLETILPHEFDLESLCHKLKPRIYGAAICKNVKRWAYRNRFPCLVLALVFLFVLLLI